MILPSFNLQSSSERKWLPYPLLLCVFAALLFFPGLGWRDFWAPVEPRYAEIARTMFAKGEWAVPSVNGTLYADKPILYFWFVLIGSKLAGNVNEWTVRLPSALSAMGLVLTTYLLGRDLFSPRIGFMGAVILATSSRVLWEARWAHTDMPFAFFFTFSLYFFSKAILQEGKQRDFLLAYGFMALATLTKGLIGLVLPGLILFAFVAARREWRAVLQWRIPLGILLFLSITLPWFAWVSTATHGKWLEEFIWIHHVRRFTSGLGHRQPFYYYLWNFPLDLLPWTVFAVPALFAYRSRRKALKEPASLFLFLWFAAIFVFFSVSRSKRGLYLLPLFPPAALFVANYFDTLVIGDASESALYRRLSGIFFGFLCVSSLSVPIAAWYFQREAVWISLPFAIAMAAGGRATLMAIRRRLPSAVFLTTACTVLAGMLCVAVLVLPFVDRYKSPRPLALLVKQTVPSAQPLYIYADTMTDFNFYTEREVIPVLSTEQDVQDLLAQGEKGYLLIKERDLDKMQRKEALKMVVEKNIGDKKWYLTSLGE